MPLKSCPSKGLEHLGRPGFPDKPASSFSQSLEALPRTVKIHQFLELPLIAKGALDNNLPFCCAGGVVFQAPICRQPIVADDKARDRRMSS
jgi:hypothetical protein